jgi:hypothetical protein
MTFAQVLHVMLERSVFQNQSSASHHLVRNMRVFEWVILHRSSMLKQNLERTRSLNLSQLLQCPTSTVILSQLWKAMLQQHLAQLIQSI